MTVFIAWCVMMFTAASLFLCFQLRRDLCPSCGKPGEIVDALVRVCPQGHTFSRY